MITCYCLIAFAAAASAAPSYISGLAPQTGYEGLLTFGAPVNQFAPYHGSLRRAAQPDDSYYLPQGYGNQNQAVGLLAPAVTAVAAPGLGSYGLGGGIGSLGLGALGGFGNRNSYSRPSKLVNPYLTPEKDYGYKNEGYGSERLDDKSGKQKKTYGYHSSGYGLEKVPNPDAPITAYGIHPSKIVPEAEKTYGYKSSGHGQEVQTVYGKKKSYGYKSGGYGLELVDPEIAIAEANEPAST